MQLDGQTVRFSATDLARQIACRHLIQLERGAIEGSQQRPYRDDPALELLMERGLAHEQAYVDELRGAGRDVVELREFEGESAVERTLTAMRAGAGVIVQGALRDGRWQGRADLLLRVETASDLGAWSYEVTDTKLAQETRGGTVLQLCLYTDLVGRAQGRVPQSMFVVKPGEPAAAEPFRFDDYAAYYRFIRKRLEETIDADAQRGTYPDPVPHCEICPWWPSCDTRRREDDHLSLVAGMQSLHRVELERQSLGTLERFAEHEMPLPEPPTRGSRDAFARLNGQAQVQLRGRREDAPVYELLDVEPERGLTRLPEPSANDLFFDLESDAFVEGGGLEYLFGWAWIDENGTTTYRSERAFDRPAERRVFETFVDEVMRRLHDDPTMHVYHFSPYEPAALKRLMGRYGTRANEIDRLLRGRRLVDLHAVTRQGVRASVERYSLKDLERFTGFTREVPLRDAARSLRRLESALELGTPLPAADLDAVRGYNREDCLSTAALRDWLERLRQEQIDGGTDVPRPEIIDGDASEAVEEREADVREVFDRLTASLADDPESWDEEQRAHWLLAHTLEYFHREDNCAWWEFHRLHELDHDDLLRERKTIAELMIVDRVGGTDKYPVHRYTFPRQEASLAVRDKVHEVGGEALGEVVSIDQARSTIDIKKNGKSAQVHASSILVNKRVPPRPLDRSLLELARSAAEHGVDGPGPYRAARDLLLKHPPRFRSEQPATLRQEDETAADAAVRLAPELDHGALAIQGPPGSGKTYTGARMIVDLAARGMRIGVTAVGHKVIRNLLSEALDSARKQDFVLEVAHKVSSPSGDVDGLEEVDSNDDALAALDAGKVVGGTGWLWARDDAEGALDYLFVDEAGQLSLAQLLAAGRSARNLILLGDPQQLEQPSQGTHPEGSGVSALEHLLDGGETIQPEIGLFLDRTWRLHPDICAFTSEVYYERRLEPRDGLDRQRLDGVGPFDGSGLFFVPVHHAGNPSSSPEEVEAVKQVLGILRGPGATWTGSKGIHRPIETEDVLVVAPYNAQVGAVSRRIRDARVGTVDRFQGQQAPVVVYTMASSSVEDAPRGMEFLFDPHRFNVATSRAQCAVILVASPALIEPDCRTPAQIRWANGVCRFLELARVVELT